MKAWPCSLQAAADGMDAENDILLLILTSHGSRAGLAVKAGRLAQTLTPSNLADMLARTGMRYKVVVISACYSGVFVPRLANPDTLVITAADADHPSFGCRDKFSVLQEVGAIRECEEHGWMQDRADPHARERALVVARHAPPPDVSPEAAAVAIAESPSATPARSARPRSHRPFRFFGCYQTMSAWRFRARPGRRCGQLRRISPRLTCR